MNLLQISIDHWINISMITDVYDDGSQLIFYFNYWNSYEDCQGYIRTSSEFYISAKKALGV